MHDKRVRGRNVEAGLHNGRGQQHIEFAVVEIRHDALKLGRSHLAMRDGAADFRHMLVQILLARGQILDARADIEGVTAAVFLA